MEEDFEYDLEVKDHNEEFQQVRERSLVINENLEVE